MTALPPHHRSPAAAVKPAGQDLEAPLAPKSDDSTAPIAVECQSFLQAVITQFTVTVCYES
jgi:hypothetical protein